MGFRIAEPFLKDVLNDIALGNTQLPDFQRGWVWDDLHIRSLIASVSLSYPVGAVMLLEAGEVPFRPRLFEGVRLANRPVPTKLVLDGQQRLTSMYLALRSGAAVTTRTERGEEVRRFYFLDMAKCLDPGADREDAIVSVPETRRVVSDFGRRVNLDVSTRDLQLQQRMFPAALVFDVPGLMAWKRAYHERYREDRDAVNFLMRFEYEVWQKFETFKLPAIELTHDTPREAVCQVFEKVNTGGVTLTVFELMTATFAADEFNLRRDWDERGERMRSRHTVLSAVDGTAFLTAVTLRVSYERSKDGGGAVACKRADVLRLDLVSYRAAACEMEAGFAVAAELLAGEKIFDSRTLPYATQLIPMAAICAVLHQEMTHPARKKLLRWYWCGVFGELYGGANESRFAADLPQVVEWIRGGDEPRSVRDSSFAPTRLLSLQTRNAAAYKGLAALLMQQGSRDLVTGTPVDINTYFNSAVDIHHIFPRAWCELHSVSHDRRDSVVNKAPLASATNKYLGGQAPSAYLSRIEHDKGVAQADLDGFLRSHAIPPELLRADDFEGFFQRRAVLLLDLIEHAMGKEVDGRGSDETKRAFGASLVGK